MPTPIAKTPAELLRWLKDYYDPEIAALLVIGPGGWAYDREALHHCERCRCTNLDEDITDGLCEPCHEEAEAESAHQGGALAMVRRL